MIDSSVFPTEPDADDIVRGNLLLAASNAAIGIAPGVGRTQRASEPAAGFVAFSLSRSMGVHRAWHASDDYCANAVNDFDNSSIRSSLLPDADGVIGH